MRVSVVVCAYALDTYPHLQDAAESVLSQTHDDVELVLVADGNEALLEAMERDYGDRSDVQIDANEANRGLSASRNRGIEVATGDVVAFMDDDAVAEPDWIAELVTGYERHDALAVGGRMAPEWVAGKPEFLPEEFYFLIGVTHRGFPEKECEVRNTFGSNISFRREVLEELGGFAERLGRKGDAQGQGEETEIAARMYEAYGERVWYVPAAVVRHKVFDYRTDPVWLAKRAFWQGYSKRVMATNTADSGEENEFLRYLLRESTPKRVLEFFHSPSLARVVSLATLYVLTALIGCGYLYGTVSSSSADLTNGTTGGRGGLRVLWLRPDKPDNVSVGRHRIARHLRAAGHDVTVQNATPRSFVDVLSLDPDVVVGTTRLGALVGAWKKLVHGTPLVVDHIDPISQLRRDSGPLKVLFVSQLEKLAFRLADHVLVVYREEVPRVERYATHVTKTSLGVDYDRFASPGPSVVERASETLERTADADRKTVVYVGSLETEYHPLTVVDALSHLHGWQFAVLGDGSQREAFERADDVRDDVTYLGTVDHELVPGFLHAADVGVCLVDDRNTLKILEYGAAGLPTVNVAGDAEEKFEGLVEFCTLDPADVARAIEAADESARTEAFREFTRQFGWEAIADEYQAIIESVHSD